MQNGNSLNGAAGAPVVQVNPVQAAQWALTFLVRADIKPPEREAYGIAEALLHAIANGSVILAPPPPRPELAPPAPPPNVSGEAPIN